MSRALVLSSGSALGFYQVGALKYAYNVLGMLAPDRVYGVSVGAVQGADLVKRPKHEWLAAVADLEQLVLNIGTRGVYKRHCPFGMAHVLGKRRSLYNLDPLKKTIRERLDVHAIDENGYTLKVGVTSLKTGKYKLVPHTDPKFEQYLYASTAQALAFPPIFIDGEWWMDGGVRNAVPLKAALDDGATDVLMVLTEAAEMPEMANAPGNGLDVGMRAISILTHEVFNNDIELAMRDATANIHIVRPSSPLIADPLNFDREQAQHLIELGYADATQQIGGAS